MSEPGRSWAPARLALIPWLRVTGFEYHGADERVATVIVSGRLRSGARPPKCPELRVRRADAIRSHAALRTELHRQPGGALHWTAYFKLPLRIAERSDVSFEIAGAGRHGLPLPPLAAPAESLPPVIALAQLAGRLTGAAELTPQRVTAVASALAFGASIGTAGMVAGGATAHPLASAAAARALVAARGSGQPTTTSTTPTSTTPPPTTTSTTPTGTTPPPTTTSTTPTGTTPPPTTTSTTPAGTTPPPTTTSTTPASTDTTPTTTTPTGTDTTTTVTTTPATTTAPAPSTTPTVTAPTSTVAAPAASVGRPPGSPFSSVLNAARKSSRSLKVTGKVHMSKHDRCVRVRVRGSRHRQHASAREPVTGKPRESGGAGLNAAVRQARLRRHVKRRYVCIPIVPPHPKYVTGHALKTAANTDGGRGLPAPPPPPPAPTLLNTTGGWGGGPFRNPFTSSELQFYASLVKNINMPPRYLVQLYKAAAHRYRLPWQLLAAINREETDYGRDLAVSSAGAVGWMQFMPATWAEYGLALDQHNKPMPLAVPNPWNARDAIFSAARYLRASGAWRSIPRAVYAYNHANWYVVQVLSIAQQINVHGLKRRSSAHRKLAVMLTTARLLDGTPYQWGGGHRNWTIGLGYDCSGFVSAVLHSVGFLKQPQTTQTLPFERGIMLGKGRWVTIYDRTDGGSLENDHVIIEIKGQFWESGGSDLAGGADRVHRIDRKDLPKGYLRSFNLRMHPYGL